MKNTDLVCLSSVPQDIRLSEDNLLELFKKLDINKDGHICNYDLSEALEKYFSTKLQKQPFNQHWIKKGGSSGTPIQISFKQFSRLMVEHEEKLWDAFNDLNINNDGVLDENDLKNGFKKYDIHIDIVEAKKLIESMSFKGSRHITFPQWRSYWTFHPDPTIHNMIPDWRRVAYVDVGEDISVPDDFTPTEIKEGMWWRHLVAGGIAGAVSRTTTAPLDRTKVFFQVHSCKYPTIISCLRHMVEEGGIQSLWRGNGINIYKIAPETAIKFTAYEKIKRSLLVGDELKFEERFLAGSLAGAISQSLVYPLEVLKTRLALRRTGDFSGITDAAVKIFKKEGPRSFFRGYLPNLIGVFPYAGIDLAIYETLKNRYIANHNLKDKNASVPIVLACAVTSSTCGQLASYPLSLAKTRLQASSEKKPLVKMFRDIVKDEGIRGLYRGFVPNFLKVAPTVGISYVAYEKVRHYLGVGMT